MITFRDIKFTFKITPVKIKENAGEERETSRALWRPPLKQTKFEPDTRNATEWLRWNGSVVEDAWTHGPIYHSCSIFWDNECGYFLVTPVDCSIVDVEKLVHKNYADQAGWRRVGFTHIPPIANRNLSVITSRLADEYKLSGRGSPTWMPQLIPDTYNNSGTMLTDLAGELSVLLGFAAFTCEPTKSDMVQTLKTSFRLPHWICHGRSIPSTKTPSECHKKGLIVTVALDSPPGRITADVLNDFQNGIYGPLIEA